MTDPLTSDGVVIPEPWVELFCDEGRGTGISVLPSIVTFPSDVVESLSLE